MAETDLYQPVKAFLEQQGYEVKGEVGHLDIMALRPNDPPVIVELKTGFSLALFHQAIDRQKVTDNVYICVPRPTGKTAKAALKNNTKLCRRLGLGLITVRLRDHVVQVHADPGPFTPRKSKRTTERLTQEFHRLVGDPNTGGMTRKGLVTAYRQDALKCLGYLEGHGPSKASDLAKATGVPKARAIMSDNHYGWFERAARGIYTLSPNGQNALAEFETELDQIRALYPAPQQNES